MRYTVEIIKNGMPPQVTVKWTDPESKRGDSMSIRFQNESEFLDVCDVFIMAKKIFNPKKKKK